ncbi:GNAT family N-acetyltransferase [Streptomyces sp. NPDC088785]|uniref:GNAT family N-acetyltransferase n=1 Tax=Streptomyces sp. NPDC088785 TaxID=3365897 RepID=UPI00380DEDF3
MPSTDARTDAGTTPAADPGDNTADAPDPTAGPAPEPAARPENSDCQDTLDLRLPDELIALIAEQDRSHGDAPRATPSDAPAPGAEAGTPAAGPVPTDTPSAGAAMTKAAPDATALAQHDLLDDVGEWGPVTTTAGVFQLVPARIDRDLALISRWMNDPAVAAFWELAGPDEVTERHLRPQVEGDGRSVPCLGVLDGRPMSYWEVYRADLDPLARHYPARPHDTGIHLLIGGVAHRGRGLGTTLLKAVSDLVLDHRPQCARVVAEPDLRNTPSVSAFLSAGFRFSAEVDLPDKRAALMIRDRALRTALQPSHSQ